MKLLYFSIGLFYFTSFKLDRYINTDNGKAQTLEQYPLTFSGFVITVRTLAEMTKIVYC